MRWFKNEIGDKQINFTQNDLARIPQISDPVSLAFKRIFS